MKVQFQIIVAMAVLFATLVPSKAAETNLDKLISRLTALEKENAALSSRIRRLERNKVADLTANQVRQPASVSSRSNSQSVREAAYAAVPNKIKPSANWNGIYVGGHFAATRSNASGIETPIAGGIGNDYAVDQSMRGWSGGIQIGADLQYGHVVLGAELSASKGMIEGNQTATVGSGPSSCFVADSLSGFTPPATLSCNGKIDWTIQFLTRFGYSLWDDRFLPYFKGGIALSRLNILYEFTQPCPFCLAYGWTGASKVLVGGVIGGGVEFSMGDGLSLGAEYLFAQYAGAAFNSSFTKTINNIGTVVDPVPTSNHSLTTQVARIFLNCRFAP